MKYCKYCNTEKPKSEFGNYKKTPDGLRHYCRSCNNEKARIWTKNNKEKKKANSLKWYEANKEKSKNLSKEWMKNNLERRRETVNKWFRDRRNTDQLFKLKMNLSCLIRNSMMLYGFKKSSKTARILGCTYEEFKIYMQNQFTDGMTWENYGEWEYDHKIPASWAKDEDEIIKLNHYTNFQPLWKIDNIKKGNKFSS
jgi:hypothetical protein